jgi:hypothetical protein
MRWSGIADSVTLENESAESNEHAAQLFDDPQQWAHNFETGGRINGHVATFGVPVVGDNVQSQAEAYISPEGAKEAFVAIHDFVLSDNALAVYTKLGYTNPTIESIDTAEVGDDSMGYSLKITVNGNELETLVIMFRRGSVLAMASTDCIPDTDDFSHVEAVAKQMDARIQTVLDR